jgi:ethanolamine-phosphate cytidylyltransferase
MEGTGSPSVAHKKQVRVWTDGCFDMMHFGHANALRQAKQLGDYLIVGVHSDAEITKNKGPPVMNEEERYKAAEACKWVDEVVRDAPYVTSLELLDKYNVDFCVHGDDLVTSADGVDTYHEVKKAGRFKTVPRTRGVSTTDLVGRMLLMTKEHHETSIDTASLGTMSEGKNKRSPYTGVSRFSTTSQRIVQFSNSAEPKPDDKVVYIDGAWDLFHIGHIEILKAAKEAGDYLLVGIHSDKEVNRIKGENHPIMNLHERVLSVLSCKYVDEVLIEAPYAVTKEIIEGFGISVVVHGSIDDAEAVVPVDPYEVPKKMGIYKVIPSPSKVTTTMILNRIIENRLKYEARNKKKEQKEIQEIAART